MKEYTVPKIEVMNFSRESILTLSVSDAMNKWAEDNAENNPAVSIVSYNDLIDFN